MSDPLRTPMHSIGIQERTINVVSVTNINILVSLHYDIKYYVNTSFILAECIARGKYLFLWYTSSSQSHPNLS